VLLTSHPEGSMCLNGCFIAGVTVQKFVKKFWFYDSVLWYDCASWSIWSDPDVLKELSAFILKACWVVGGNRRLVQPVIGYLVGFVLEDAGICSFKMSGFDFAATLCPVLPQERKLHLYCCERQIINVVLSCSAEIANRMLLNYTSMC